MKNKNKQMNPKQNKLLCFLNWLSVRVPQHSQHLTWEAIYSSDSLNLCIYTKTTDQSEVSTQGLLGLF